VRGVVGKAPMERDHGGVEKGKSPIRGKKERLALRESRREWDVSLLRKEGEGGACIEKTKRVSNPHRQKKRDP